MEVSIIMLYVVSALTLLVFVGMGVIAFLDWRTQYLWEKVKKEIDESIVFDNDIIEMSHDQAILRDCKVISKEFETTENDGLEEFDPIKNNGHWI